MLAVPVSFVSEHIETLEEMDMEYRELVGSWGVCSSNCWMVFADLCILDFSCCAACSSLPVMLGLATADRLLIMAWSARMTCRLGCQALDSALEAGMHVPLLRRCT
jgi:Ferrochelatase